MLYSSMTKPVALPPGCAMLSAKPAPTGSTTLTNTTGMVRVACKVGPTLAAPDDRMTSGASAANSTACLRISSGIARAQAIVDLHVAALAPAQLLQRLRKNPEAGLHVCIVGVHARARDHADAPHRSGLLRPRRERPRRRRAAEQRDELAASQ